MLIRLIRGLLVFTVRAVVLMVALSAVGAAVWFFLTGESVEVKRATKNPINHPPFVDVITVKAKDFTPTIRVYAEAKPLWHSRLTAAVGGLITKIHPSCRSGCSIAAGTELIEIDDRECRMELAMAEQRLAQAQLAVAQERAEAELAREQWQTRNDGSFTEAPDLLTRTPQLAAVEASLAAAQEEVSLAKQRLKQTVIQAPFDGVVVTRHVSLGERLQPGAPVVEVYATAASEITIFLDGHDRRTLGAEFIGKQVRVESTDHAHHWEGHILRQGATIDPETRMSPYIVGVDTGGGAQSIQPGQLLLITITGPKQRGMLQIPEGCLTSDGHLLHIDDEYYVNVYPAHNAQFSDGLAYVKPVDARKEWTFIRHPMSHVRSGDRITPVLRDNHD